MKTLICYRGRFNRPTTLDKEDWSLPYQYGRSPNFDRLYFLSVEKVEITMPETIDGHPITLCDIDMSHYLQGKSEHRDYHPEYDEITIKVLEQL